jgi:hypothetical protein
LENSVRVLSAPYGAETLTHGNIIQTVEVRQGLCVSLVLDQFLCASVQKSDVLRKKVNAYTGDVPGIKTTHWVSSEDLLSIKFQDKSEHTVRGGMLRTKIIAMNGTVTSGEETMPKQLTRSLLWGPIVSKSTLSRSLSKEKRRKKTHQ